MKNMFILWVLVIIALPIKADPQNNVMQYQAPAPVYQKEPTQKPKKYNKIEDFDNNWYDDFMQSYRTKEAKEKIEREKNKLSISEQTDIAISYYNKKDYINAKKHFELAAKQGDAYAQNALGHLYLEGYGTKKNYETAKYWYELAAKQGFSYAQFTLGYLYDKGKSVEQNYETAKYWYELAAKQGLAQAQFNLGVLYYNGWGVDIDYKAAQYWGKLALEQKHKTAQKLLNILLDKEIELAESYFNKKDYQNAVYYFELAAKQGSAYAQLYLGIIYDNGFGAITQDHEISRNWLKKSANQKNSDAQYNLGHLYARGRGVTKNYETAAYYFELAAKQGDAKAQNALGDLYTYGGEGFITNFDIAEYWYKKAAKQGIASAKENLDQLDNPIFRAGRGLRNYYEENKEEMLIGALKFIDKHKEEIIIGTVAVGTGYLLSQSDYCFRPNDDCTRKQEKNHKIFYEHVSNELSYKSTSYQNKVCSNYEYLKDFLRNGGLAIFSSSLDVLSATMTGTFSGETLNNIQLLIDVGDLTTNFMKDGHCRIS